MAGADRTRPDDPGTPQGAAPERRWGRVGTTVTAYLLSTALTFTAVGLIVARSDLVEKERRIAELEQQGATIAGQRDAVERRLLRAIRDLEATTRHQRETIVRLGELREAVRRELLAAERELAALAEERDAARELAASLGDGVRDHELWRRDAEKEKGALSAKLASLEAKLASLTEERDLARRAEKGLRWRLEQAEEKLASLDTRRQAEARPGPGRAQEPPASLRGWVSGQVEAVEKVLAKAGVRLERLLARADDEGHEGVGGPLVPAGQRGVEVASLGPGGADAAGRQLALQRVMAALPLSTPLDGYRVMSEFGVRQDPIRKRRAMHEGIDLSGARGEEVLSTQAGRVVHAGADGAYGITVVLDHGMGITTRYAHLRKVLVRKGDRVAARRPIGIIGSTGRSTGRHLHYEIRLDGKALDPAPFLEAKKRFGSVLKG